MMISKADFEELFPDLFPRKSRSSLGDRQTDTCVGHPKEDGKRTTSVYKRGNDLNARSTGVDTDASKLAPVAANWGIIPALTAMGAAWVMLAGFGYLPRN